MGQPVDGVGASDRRERRRTLWHKAAVAAAIWVVVPLAAGTVRVLRRPIG